NDLRHMGGLRKKMPITGLTFLVACLAISAVPPFSGFFSKDMILDALKEAHLGALYGVAAGVSFLTAFYIFRIYFLAFEGDAAVERDANAVQAHAEHGGIHESPWTMTLPLLVLAVLSCLVGFAGLSWQGHSFGSYIRFDRSPTLAADWNKAAALASLHPEAVGDYSAATALWQGSASTLASGGTSASPAAGLATASPSAVTAPMPSADTQPAVPLESRAFTLDWSVSLPATTLALSGLFLAYALYRRKWLDPARVAARFGPVHTLVYNKYYVDEFYRWLLDHGYYVLSAGIAWFDRHVVDGCINGLAWASQLGASGLRRVQTGRVQAYALGILAGVLLLLASLKVLF
ncbi:MAG: proton-conducting transporter membrane subunit, partial [bacterium]